MKLRCLIFFVVLTSVSNISPIDLKLKPSDQLLKVMSEINKTVKNAPITILTHVKAIPLIGAGSLSLYYALTRIANESSELYNDLKNNDSSRYKIRVLYTTANTLLAFVSVMIIAKSDAIISSLMKL